MIATENEENMNSEGEKTVHLDSVLLILLLSNTNNMVGYYVSLWQSDSSLKAS